MSKQSDVCENDRKETTVSQCREMFIVDGTVTGLGDVISSDAKYCWKEW